MERFKIKWIIAGCALVLLSSAWLLFFYYRQEINDRIEISPDSGVYNESIRVSVKTFQEDKIYYTTDGCEPSGNRDNVKEYTGPLDLYPGSDGRTYSFRFFVQHEDGTLSEAAERNYVILEESRQPDVDYIVSIKGDEEAFFDPEEGIFVTGSRFEEFLAQNPDADILREHNIANYFADVEIPVHAAVFREGEEIISQDCGLKIAGKGTRAKNQKSIRLIARHVYDEKNEFSYVFFDQLFSDNAGGRIGNFQRLTLHNSGDDNGYGFIRNALCSELARQAGFPDVLVSRSAAVYINDRYMGVYWLQNTYDDRYFSEKYGFYQGEMAVCEGRMGGMEISDEQEVWEREAAERYNEFCNWLSGADMNDPVVWDRVAETIDVENFLYYAAIEYYINNKDWPHNNVKVYQYVPGERETYREGTVFDGRYRYLLFDLDYGMGLMYGGEYGRDARTEILADLCDPSGSALVFAKLMERGECRDQFVNQVLNLMNGSFSAKNINMVLDVYNTSRWNELEYMIEHADYLQGYFWESEEIAIDNVSVELEEIRVFAEQRMAFVLAEMNRRWDCGTLYSVLAAAPDDIQVCVAGQPVQDNSLYFAGIPVEISVDAPAWIHVLGYEVNGCFLEGETVKLSGQDYLAGQDVLTVVPYTETVETERLSIREFSVRGSGDRIILHNTGNVALRLADYYLSDDREKLLKEGLPDIVLEPGESITVYGSNYEGGMAEKSCQIHFSWNETEPIILSHIMKGVVEERTP